MIEISVVIPVYKGESMLEELVTRLNTSLSKIASAYEIILVEDGSPDESWERIKVQASEHSFVKGVKLSRNFGQHYAITAGLEKSRGEWVVVMDCDLQDRPEEIPNLFQHVHEADLVLARRVIRKDNFAKRMSSKAFYSVFSYLTNTIQDPSVANFGIYKRKVIDAVLSMKDHIRYFPTMSQWVGFKRKYYDVDHGSRLEGKTSYSVRKLFNLALDNIVAFSDKPMLLTIRLGLLVSLFALLAGVYNLKRFLDGDIVVLGYTSLIISVWFLSGLIIFILGIVGTYLGKTFERVKERPVYIIDELIE